MFVAVRSEPLDPWAEVQAHQARLPALRGKAGATAVFVGTMRDFNDGSDVRAMTLEHYPGMTERRLAQIATEAHARWPLEESLIVHRVGALAPGDPIVVVAAWSAHRGAAFEACRFLIEDLKHRAPFWKKESRPDGERWVGQNTSG